MGLGEGTGHSREEDYQIIDWDKGFYNKINGYLENSRKVKKTIQGEGGKIYFFKKGKILLTPKTKSIAMKGLKEKMLEKILKMRRNG